MFKPNWFIVRRKKMIHRQRKYLIIYPGIKLSACIKWTNHSGCTRVNRRRWSGKNKEWMTEIIFTDSTCKRECADWSVDCIHWNRFKNHTTSFQTINRNFISWTAVLARWSIPVYRKYMRSVIYFTVRHTRKLTDAWTYLQIVMIVENIVCKNV